MASAVASAELYRTAPLGYGKFEARVQFAAGDGVISSFFLWKDGSEQSSVYWNELDFEKLGADCRLQTNSIYGLPQTNHEGHGYDLTGLCEGYHTYAYEWTPEYIAWSVDGTEIRRDTGADAAAYSENASDGMQVRFNVWPGNANFGGNFDEAILPVYQFIAWAQYSEYTPGAGDDGSDFTHSWREEFDGPPAGWSRGSWESPLNLSTHDSQNVVFVDGVAVLALTADDATGYAGTPPQDDPTGSMGGADGSGGSSQGAGGAPDDGVGGTPDGAGGSTAAGGSGAPPVMSQGGCSYAHVPGPGKRVGLVGMLLLAGLAGLISRRRRGAKAPRCRECPSEAPCVPGALA